MLNHRIPSFKCIPLFYFSAYKLLQSVSFSSHYQTFLADERTAVAVGHF